MTHICVDNHLHLFGGCSWHQRWADFDLSQNMIKCFMSPMLLGLLSLCFDSAEDFFYWYSLIKLKQSPRQTKTLLIVLKILQETLDRWLKDGEIYKGKPTLKFFLKQDEVFCAPPVWLCLSMCCSKNAKNVLRML